MNLNALLFSPNGRIGPRTFWRGVILLVGAQIAFQLLSAFVPQSAAPAFFALNLGFLALLFWAYLSVYAKRLHDCGRTAAWFILALLSWLAMNVVAYSTVFPMLFPEIWKTVQSMVDARSQQEADSLGQTLQAQVERRQTPLFLMGLAIMLATNGLIGAALAGLAGDRGTNRFGPPESADPDTFI